MSRLYCSLVADHVKLHSPIMQSRILVPANHMSDSYRPWSVAQSHVPRTGLMGLLGLLGLGDIPNPAETIQGSPPPNPFGFYPNPAFIEAAGIHYQPSGLYGDDAQKVKDLYGGLTTVPVGPAAYPDYYKGTKMYWNGSAWIYDANGGDSVFIAKPNVVADHPVYPVIPNNPFSGSVSTSTAPIYPVPNPAEIPTFGSSGSNASLHFPGGPSTVPSGGNGGGSGSGGSGGSGGGGNAPSFDVNSLMNSPIVWVGIGLLALSMFKK